MDCQKCFTKLPNMRNTQSEIKPIKIGKRPGTTYCLGCRDCTHNFRAQEVKMTNRVLKVLPIEIGKKIANHNHDKYITTPEFNTLAADVFNARLAQVNLITKTDFVAKLLSLNRKITAHKTKDLLVENELNKLKSFGSSYFIGKSHFEGDVTQN